MYKEKVHVLQKYTIMGKNGEPLSMFMGECTIIIYVCVCVCETKDSLFQRIQL
jgi:hypothetical protein